MILLSDFAQALENLRAQKTRTLLTTSGIVFGVGSVIGMMAIGAGAKEETLQFIERLGVRNIMVDSVPASSSQEMQQRRQSSPGLTHRDARVLHTNIDAIEAMSVRKTMRPAALLPKPSQNPPEMYGVEATYSKIHSLRLAEGGFFDERADQSSAAVAVLGETAKVSLLGYEPALGKFVKIDGIWLEVVGVLEEQVAQNPRRESSATPDVNNVIYIPINTFEYRFQDPGAGLKDELAGVDLQVAAGQDSIEVAKIVTAVLDSTHRGTADFTVTIPADLLAQQQRTQAIFTYVMVAIAAISLLVGGIGIMNIVLATVLERTREIGVRRSVGARRLDIARQFVSEAVLISAGGGMLGIGFGFILAWGIARTAEWTTIVSTMSVVMAFGVSVTVGVLFGVYPALKAARIDPIDALRYE
ncbi:MAG TPA: ABC transporter permease [Vicinamibacterales bacterium]